MSQVNLRIFVYRDLGNFNKDLFIEMGEFTELHWGCGATFYGEFWYFGGDYRDKHERQVSFFKSVILM